MSHSESRPPSSADPTDLRYQVTLLQRELDDCRRERQQTRFAERRFHLFAESVQDYALITVDADYRVTSWNRGAEYLLGWSEAGILGQSGYVFFTPEDRVHAHDRHQQLAAAEKEGRAEKERWYLRKDGSRFWGCGVITPLPDVTGGGLPGYAEVIRDLSARRLAEQRLAYSEQNFRLFVDSVTEYALVPIDVEGRIAGWNTGAARTFGYHADEILGQPMARLFASEDQAAHEPECDLGQALTGGQVEAERWMVRRDGSRFWARWVTTPMYDAGGGLRGFAKVLRDETERKQEEEARERRAQQEREQWHGQVLTTGQELDRTKEELRALAASLLTMQEEERRRIARELHDDLAQRLSLLEIGLGQLREELTGNEPQMRTELNRLEQEAAHLSHCVRHLSHQLHPALLDALGLRVALHRLTEEFQLTHPQRVGYQADDDVRDDLPMPVAAALYRIAQEALRNISKHARQAEVTVLLTEKANQLRLVIQDTGPGFDPALMRGKEGLGFISMQERTYLIGGGFQLRSHPGQGTTIEVQVPLPVRVQ